MDRNSIFNPARDAKMDISLSMYRPLNAIKNKQLRNENRESQEYLYGQLVGVRNSHLNMFPRIWDMLERAKSFDWNRKVVGPDESTDASGYVVVNHGSFENLYEDLVEPWLGKYDSLREIAGRHERGEISLDEGVNQIELGRRGAPAGNNNAAKEQENKDRKPTFVLGRGRDYDVARLRRDRPDLAARIGERLPNGKKFTANAAAIEAGFRSQATPLQRMLRWVPDLTEDEWQQLVDARNKAYEAASE